MPKIRPVAELRLNAWAILSEAVERGVAYGWTRAHKHTSMPTGEYIQEQITTAVQNEIAELLEHE